MDGAQIPERSRGLATVFVGTGGLRADWRPAIFPAIVSGLTIGAQLGLPHVPAFERWVRSLPYGWVTPESVLSYEGPELRFLAAATGVMCVVEHGALSQCGLPAREEFGKRFWLGTLVGPLGRLPRRLRGYSHAADIKSAGWRNRARRPSAAALLTAPPISVVTLYDEFLFRGYHRKTVTSGIGFWPACIVLSVGFGALHLASGFDNPASAPIAATLATFFAVTAPGPCAGRSPGFTPTCGRLRALPRKAERTSATGARR